MFRNGEDSVWVSTVNGKHVRADERLKKIGDKPEDVIKKCLDARLFGATIPVGGDEKGKKGKSHAFTGPVQFSWGYSLHPVELVDSATITSMFMGREVEEEAERYGTVGKGWRLHYSLVAFHGVVSALRSKVTGATTTDIEILDNLLWKGVTLDATTRSKIGHWPHLYLRLEYKEPDFLMGDLRKFIETKHNDIVRDFDDLSIDFTKLVKTINENDQILRAYVCESTYCADRYSISKQIEERKRVVLPHKIEVKNQSISPA